MIADGRSVIYEAAFIFDEVLAAADIVVQESDGLYIYEVKSSTSVSEVYVNDAAVQYWIISNLGYKVKDISIVYINNKYKRNGSLDLDSLFNIESVLEKVLAKQKFINEEVERQKKILSKREIPRIDIGMHCTDPYPCAFMGYCRKHIPEESIFDIAGMFVRSMSYTNKTFCSLKTYPMTSL